MAATNKSNKQAAGSKSAATAPIREKTGRIRDRNEQIILDAAEEEFVLRGFKGAAIQAIADRANLPKANVHYYFESKEKLYTTVLNRIVSLWNTQFSEISADDDPAKALDSLVCFLLQTYPSLSR